MRETRRVCLITGAARGIGRAIAVRLAENDRWRLTITDRSREPLIDLIRDGGLSCEDLALTCDVTNEAEVVHAISETVANFGRLDALVCAAGVGMFRPTVETSTEEWDAQIGANLTGIFLCAREALKVMVPAGSGHIVTLLSVASRIAFPNSAAYVASKWGAYGLTRSLAEETRGMGVRVTGILPGAVNTNFWDTQSRIPDRALMLPPEAVVDAVLYALESPASVSIDEIHLTPPQGIL